MQHARFRAQGFHEFVKSTFRSYVILNAKFHGISFLVASSVGGLELWQRRSSHERSCSTLSPVSTGMGDRLRAGIPSEVDSSLAGR